MSRAQGRMTPNRDSSVLLLPVWAQLIVGLATLRTALAYVTASATPGGLPLPTWVYAAVSLSLTVIGLGLLFLNRRDARAAWLGGLFILTGTPLATPIVGLIPSWGLRYVRPDALAAAFLWHFLARFPSELDRRAGRLVRAAAGGAALVGALCAIANAAAIPSALAPALRTGRLVVGAPGSVYWLLTLGMVALALPLLLWRAQVARGSDRQRIRLFIRGLIIGIAPFTLEVFFEEMWPAYKTFAHMPSIGPWIGALIFGALATIPFVTAYSVLFDRVIELRVALHLAMQHALARYTIVAATLVPFAALTAFVFQHRTEPVVSLVTGPRPLVLGALVALGLLALRSRSRWMDHLDRRYFREAYDVRQILTRFMGDLQTASAEELASRIRMEISTALHADAEVFLADEARTTLRHVDDRLPPLGATAALAGLAMADSAAMDVDLASPASPLRRLPAAERQWIEQGNFGLLIALRGANRLASGILALTPKRSGLPFSADDRYLIAAIGSAAGLAFDNLRLRDSPEGTPEPPASECVRCQRLHPADTSQCPCGGAVIAAAVPYVLRNTFRFEQRIGAGGMGVVYRAVDTHLGRDVAIKALPNVTPERVRRIRREARTMAVGSHPNLAVIHSVELWRGVPFLVQEYLAGGTLTQRLAGPPMPIGDVVDLGATLAGVLEHLHGRGVVHCDIKPSNIGFTQDAVAKLLDFGLARILRDVHVAADSPSLGAADTQSLGTGPLNRVFGTPRFMSPEAICGDPPSPMFDLWSLAVVLFEAIARCPPFDGPDLQTIFSSIVRGQGVKLENARPDAPPDVVAFFESALARNPASRPQTAGQMRAALICLRGDR
jgi:Protein kinase domain